MGMDEKALQDLLETVDILRLISMKGRAEARHFARYMVAFGLYAAFNIFADQIVGRPFWVPTLYVAFFGATAATAGVLPALLIWGAAGALAGAIALGTGSPGWTIAGVLLTCAGGVIAAYGVGASRGRLADLPPLRVAIAPRIGWAWGVIMGGMAVLMAGLDPASLPPGAVTAMWGYAIGIGLFISGVMFPLLFPLGLIGTFGVPLLALSAGRPDLAYGLEGLMGLGMAGIGLLEWRARRA